MDKLLQFFGRNKSDSAELAKERLLIVASKDMSSDLKELQAVIKEAVAKFYEQKGYPSDQVQAIQYEVEEDAMEVVIPVRN